MRGVVLSGFITAKLAGKMANRVEGWTMTRPGSLGLLPSGPDPVGEWYVHHQPSAFYIGYREVKDKRLWHAKFTLAQAGQTG